MATDYSLLDLADVKTYLGITDTAYDAKIDAASPIVTQWFEDYCSRGLAYVADQTDDVQDFNGVAIYLTRYPIESVASVTLENSQEITAYKINKNGGVLRVGFCSWSYSTPVEVVYAGGYLSADVPSDLAMAFASCVGSQIGYTGTTGAVSGSTEGAAPIKQLGLGSGALSIQFDTASSGGESGGYDISDCPPVLQPYAGTLRRYKAHEVV